ncbi:MAG: anti-sigma factor family protein [Rhodothermales bacterium]
MTDLTNAPSSELASCSDGREEALNLYMDGELPFVDQPSLFAHLATCDHCRRTLSAMMEFRRMSRQEVLTVPVTVDDAFFKRLDKMKRGSKRVDRYVDRRPLWHVRAPVSLRAATMAAMVLFIAGLMFPRNAGEPAGMALVEGLEERVEFVDQSRYWREAVYVFYPGLTVEAPRLDERAVTDPL